MSEQSTTATAIAPASASAPEKPTLALQGSESLDGGAMAVWGGRGASIDNFDGTDLEKFQRRMICMSDAEKGGDHLNETLLVKYWLVHEVEIAGEDGEVTPCFRVVLVTPEGKAYGFVSEVLARGVREIYQEYGRAVLDPPLAVQVKQKATGKGRRCYVLVPVVGGRK